MEFAKMFLGKEHDPASIDEAIFNKLFYTAGSKDLFIIKSKTPLPYQDRSTQHSHDNYEFTIPLTHSPKLLIENKQFILPRKNIFPSNPGQNHGPAEATDQHRIIAIQISPHNLKEIASLLFDNSYIEFQNTPVFADYHIENLIELFLYESQNKQTGYEFIMEHLGSLLGATILRKLKSNIDLHEKNLNEIKKIDIKRALDYLHTNLNQDFSLSNVAELAGLSKYHFIRVFKKETGKTPYQYFVDLKIEKAVKLIKTKQYPITEISFLCGFKDHSHFSRVFLSKTGMSPSQYKKRLN